MVFTTAEHAPYILQHSKKLSRVQLVVLIDNVQPDNKQTLHAWGQDKGVEIMDIDEGCIQLFRL